jgi:hypothetical protein
MRMLSREDLDELSRELRMEAYRSAAWRGDFMAGGMEILKAVARKGAADPVKESHSLRSSAHPLRHHLRVSQMLNAFHP